MALDDSWFTEIHLADGSAFSLKIRGKLEEVQSPFQKIEIFDTEHFGHLMTIDGFYMVSTRDNFLYHEMMTHPALYSHASPENVLIIGGGDCGTLQQVLKHDCVKQVTQIDIDEQVTRLAETYFPELCTENNDPRAHIAFDDGIEYIRNAPDQSLDLIIVDSTDPIGPGEGLFNLAFHQQCFRALKDRGLFVQQSESPLYHLEHIIKPVRKNLLAANFQEVHTYHFPQAIYPSGWWTGTIAVKNASLTFHRQQAAKEKPFATKYYNDAIHHAAFATPEFMKNLDV